MKREWDAWLPVTFYHSRDQQQPPTTYHRLPAYLSTTNIHKNNSFDCDKNGTKEHVATTSALDDRVCRMTVTPFGSSDNPVLWTPLDTAPCIEI